MTGLIAGILYTRHTANYTASHQNGVIADTTGGTFTVTLPITPSIGDFVVIADGGDWSVTNLTVGRNGSTIADDAADMLMDVGGVSVNFVYDGTTWQIFTTLASDGTQYASAAQGALADTAVQPSTSPTLTGLTLTGAATGTDLTLSGGVYLGGVAAANKLDFYEEGIFTPTCTAFNAVVANGYYRLINDTCFVWLQMGNVSSITAGAVQISLPFTSAADQGIGLAGSVIANRNTLGVVGAYVGNSSSLATFLNSPVGDVPLTQFAGSGIFSGSAASFAIYVSLKYRIA